MTQHEKIWNRILRGDSDANISFHQLCEILRNFGFLERIKGSHHIYTREDVEEIINIQPNGANAKAYQVKQIRNIVVKYGLLGE